MAVLRGYTTITKTMTTWCYYKIVGWYSCGELRAIMRSETEDYIPEEIHAINEQLGGNWNIRPITQAEFETYQVFGIKEIKL